MRGPRGRQRWSGRPLVPKRILTRTPSEYVRFAALYMRARLGTSVRASSGTYGIHLPWYFANAAREGPAGISGGIDDCMLARMVDNGTRRVDGLQGTGAVPLDVENV